MDRDLSIRMFQPTDEEYAAVAAIAAQYTYDELVDFEDARADDLRAFDESFAGTGYLLRRYVGVIGEEIAGYAQLFQIPWLREPGHFWAVIRVARARQRQGIGSRLYDHAIEELRRQGAVAIRLEVFESQPAIAAHVERLGFHELFRSWEFSLDTHDFNLSRFQGAVDRAAGRGITITTLVQERERGADWLPRLYELHAAITRDIPLPGHPHPAPGLAWFERYACGLPVSMPDAYFIATDGQRYVGESCLHRIEAAPDELSQKTTGVLSAYRGYGIAVALKLRTIAYARQHGYARIWTGVESNNPSMLAINAKLGFVQGLGVIVFEKRLE
jgi:ribosomal protein S18 acetylase RimI-like enzyme